jgi:hypothetical protein
MRSRRFVTAAVVAGSVAAGAVAGATVFAPGLGLAQDSSSSSFTSQSTEDGSGRVCVPGDQLAAAANAIGIEESALRAALDDGQTIAEVAQEHGVAVDTVVDAMVAEAEADLGQAVEDDRLTQAEADEKRADLRDKITAMVNGEAPLGRGFGGWGHDGRNTSGDDATEGSTSAA